MDYVTSEQLKELCQLLKEAQRLSLEFDVVSAYIRRAYIDAQNELNVKIDVALRRLEVTP